MGFCIASDGLAESVVGRRMQLSLHFTSLRPLSLDPAGLFMVPAESIPLFLLIGWLKTYAIPNLYQPVAFTISDCSQCFTVLQKHSLPAVHPPCSPPQHPRMSLMPNLSSQSQARGSNDSRRPPQDHPRGAQLRQCLNTLTRFSRPLQGQSRQVRRPKSLTYRRCL